MEDLPILKYESDIISGLLSNDTICVIGRPGTGKSTQVPQFLLSYTRLFPRDKLIGITQPRRIAALGVYNRLKDELGDDYKVGFHVGNEKKLCESNLVKVMTDGILLRELQSDMMLIKYSAIILDEVQARRVNTDVLCAVLIKISSYRKSIGIPLKVIFLSADIEIYNFISSLDPKTKPSLVDVEGETFKVTNHFLKVDTDDYIESSLKFIKGIHSNLPEGSILVFLPGKHDINKLQQRITDIQWNEPLCPIPLHSQLSQDQLKVSLTHQVQIGKRLCYISTNIAETSITLPNIRYVIDCGKVKKRIYSATTKTFQYIISWESKASAKQRAGRAGRNLNGHCYYLFSNNTYFTRLPESDDPEISILPLESSILTVLSLGIPQYFDLIQKLYRFSKVDYEVAQTSLLTMQLINSDMNISYKGILCASLPFSLSSSYLISSFAKESENLLKTVATFAYLLEKMPEKVNESLKGVSNSKKNVYSDILAIVEYFHSNPDFFLSGYLVDDFRMTIKKCLKLFDFSFESTFSRLTEQEAERFCKILAKNFKSNIAIRMKLSSQYEIQIGNDYIVCEVDEYSLIRSDLPKYIIYLGAMKVGTAIKLQYLTRVNII